MEQNKSDQTRPGPDQIRAIQLAIDSWQICDTSFLGFASIQIVGSHSIQCQLLGEEFRPERWR